MGLFLEPCVLVFRKVPVGSSPLAEGLKLKGSTGLEVQDLGGFANVVKILRYRVGTVGSSGVPCTFALWTTTASTCHDETLKRLSTRGHQAPRVLMVAWCV